MVLCLSVLIKCANLVSYFSRSMLIKTSKLCRGLQTRQIILSTKWLCLSLCTYLVSTTSVTKTCTSKVYLFAMSLYNLLGNDTILRHFCQIHIKATNSNLSHFIVFNCVNLSSFVSVTFLLASGNRN